MKRAILTAIAALGVVFSVAAQSVNAPSSPVPSGQTITVSGRLELIDGTIGLRSGGVVYYTPELRKLAGFVPAVREGADVTLTGYSYAVANKPGYAHLAVVKVSVDGKDYELSTRSHDTHNRKQAEHGGK